MPKHTLRETMYRAEVARARTADMKPDRVSEAIRLIGPPWNTCLNEACRRKARAHMAVLASQDAGKLGVADIAVQGLRSIGIIARTGDRATLIVPSDQWSKAYA